MRIEIDPQTSALLESRGIRVEDIEKVITQAAETKKGFTNAGTGHSLASYRPSKTTYWIEYGCEQDVCRIYTAYSHRMEILEGFNLPAKIKKTTDWVCLKCAVPLEVATVKLTYLDETFAADTPACPSCHIVFISESDAVEKMALAEKLLEDK
ncbi:MAG TPA: hypothetical protein VLZ07_04335 [Syntrophales bacterium]|nr:hypothetical protein [Syntrophales bacterium]